LKIHYRWPSISAGCSWLSLACAWSAVILLASISAIPVSAGAQSPHSLAQARKLYVDQFSEGDEAALLRQSLIRRLEKSGKYQIVDKADGADAVVKGSGEIWIKGYLAINPRTPASNRQPVYGGFLSAEVVARDGEPLWSYLVTPSKLAWGSIRDDLANNLVKQMLLASEESVVAGSSSAVTQKLARTDLAGSGATFPAPLYRKWFASFERLHPEIHISYDATGSESGTLALAGGKVDFAASDLSALDAGAAQSGTSARRIASVLGAVVPAYNLKGVNHDLKFTGDVLADIYLGRIRKWNDPKIRSLNKDADLPDAEIRVIHRSDGSGTTYAWSEFLSKESPAWKSVVGTGVSLTWPVGSGADGNEGVATTVQQTPNSIGYVELVYAIQHHVNFGALHNSAGEYIRADLDSLAEAASATTGRQDANSMASIIYPVGKRSYPVTTFTWFLLPREIKDPAKKAALIALLRWILTSGQKECSSLGYAPLPREVAARQLAIVDGFR